MLRLSDTSRSLSGEGEGAMLWTKYPSESAQSGTKGRSSSCYREMIDRNLAHIIGAQRDVVTVSMQFYTSP